MKLPLISIVALIAATTLSLSAFSYNEAFDSREATIEGIQNAVFSRAHSCRDIVSSFIARIEAFNPTINAIITLNADALTIADDLDSRIASGNTTGSLFCIPVLLKDNYDAVGMKTTGGCVAMMGNEPLKDAPTVSTLRRAGAVILGKTNLHEMALEGISVSSLGGQTVNPYDHTRTPGGSSGGAGAAIAANFAVLGTGENQRNMGGEKY
jgi:Asp-tRNA(Asn)/Glu-tRNA(Gln) amidotransferase A subunit family amidase